ncbi:MAG: MgtC/SapB family protein [Peptostreptococcaceae bacterium]|nr:MgtC/SapB family protein [Peptostreptococcaceae bacterium]
MLKTSSGVKRLTTAASIWSTVCIGITIGYGYYFLAIVSSIKSI